MRLTRLVDCFIELFAYFFLRLYKSGLIDIKFYQNELTNIDMKSASLLSALVTEDKEIIKLVSTELSRTERNFVLKKDESTVDLEKAKIEGKGIREVLEQLTSIIKQK